MESQIKSIMKNEIKTLREKIRLELDDVISHMKKNSLKYFTDIKDEIYLNKWKHFNEMLIGLDYLRITFKKMYDYDYFDEDID